MCYVRALLGTNILSARCIPDASSKSSRQLHTECITWLLCKCANGLLCLNNRSSVPYPLATIITCIQFAHMKAQRYDPADSLCFLPFLTHSFSHSQLHRDTSVDTRYMRHIHLCIVCTICTDITVPDTIDASHRLKWVLRLMGP
jgi:hypothetical protein